LVKKLSSTPQADGFYMPGEFSEHRGCWMLWPERPDNWRLGAKPAQEAFARVAREISRFEPITVGVSRQQYENARHLLPETVRVVELSCNDAWIRDTGPSFVKNGNVLRAVDWKFNAYGGLKGGAYFPWDQDQLIAEKVAQIEGVDIYPAPLILEGGSIHVDGEGTCLTTEECLLNPNRNPELTREKIEELLRQYLGVEKILWLKRGVYKDSTDGHVDNMACFVRPGEILLHWTDDEEDPQYPISREALEYLERTPDARGRKLKIHKIHQPGPLFVSEEESKGLDLGEIQARGGSRLPASYINYYLPRGGVIVPLFADPYDQPALELMEKLYPRREVVGVFSREIILGGGNIHCITQQVPK